MNHLSDPIELAVARGDVPGAAAVILGHRAGVAAAGVRDASTNAPMSLNAVGWIASMTKPLVAVAALRLVARGALSLDEPIGRLLPALADPSVLAGFDPAGAPILAPAREPITLRRLLSHSSGYGYARWNAGLLRAAPALGIDAPLRDWDSLARVPLLFEPGAQWAYGIGVDVAGKLIEAATGATLDAIVAAEVTGPLGMADTRFVLTDAQRARAAAAHMRVAGRWAPARPVGGHRLAFLAGGGGLHGTAADYALFVAELLRGAPRLLSPAGWDELTRNQIGPLVVKPLRTTDPAQSLDVDFVAGQQAKWSLAFMINPAASAGRRSAGSLFWGGLANSFFWVDPTAGVAGVLVTNTLPFGDPRALGLFEAVERAAYG